jgi:hypothetical protein
VRAVVVNSGNANACTGEQGERDAREMCDRVAAPSGAKPHEVLVCSTGVIGHALCPWSGCAPASTPRWPRCRPIPLRGGVSARHHDHRRLPQGARRGRSGALRVAGVCKGAGMIHPDMATMLAFVATDAAPPPRPCATRSPPSPRAPSTPCTSTRTRAPTTPSCSSPRGRGEGASRRDARAAAHVARAPRVAHRPRRRGGHQGHHRRGHAAPATTRPPAPSPTSSPAPRSCAPPSSATTPTGAAS